MHQDVNHSDTPDPIKMQHDLDELEELQYPVKKGALVDAAKKHHLDDRVVAMLEEVPEEEISDPLKVSTHGGSMK